MGRDMRTSGPRMAAAFIDGVLSRGVNVIDIGLSSTDQLWFASGWLDLPGAMFTASHNPSEYNGIKFCLAGAKPITPAALAEIADRASATEPMPAVERGQRSEQDLLPAYANYLHSLVDLSGIRRLRVVADAGNGMAGYTLPAVLGDDDLELIGLFLDLDGTFPTTRRTRSSPRTCSMRRRRSATMQLILPWSSTATQIVASSSMSAARWSARRNHRDDRQPGAGT